MAGPRWCIRSNEVILLDSTSGFGWILGNASCLQPLEVAVKNIKEKSGLQGTRNALLSISLAARGVGMDH